MNERNDAISRGLNTTDRAIDSIVSYANTNKEIIRKDIVNACLLLVIFGIFGCFDFVNMSFNIAKLLTAAYWTKTLTKVIAGICAFHIGINFSWDREIEKDQNLEENAKKYNRLIKCKEQKSFNTYILDIVNPREKIKAYISQINRKIYLLDRTARNRDKLLYSSDREEDKAKKLKNRYCVKKAELEQLKSDEFIKKNINSLQVKYSYIDPIVFDLEIDGRSTYKGLKVKGNVAVGKAKRTASTIAGMVMISMFTASLFLNPNSEEFAQQLNSFWYWFVNCCMDIGIILWKVLQGFTSSRKIISSELTTPLATRNQILTEYIDWCVANNIETSKATMIYNKIIESEALEK